MLFSCVSFSDAAKTSPKKYLWGFGSFMRSAIVASMAEDEWRSLETAPSKTPGVYRVRLPDGRETWALCVSTKDWRAWNGVSPSKAVSPAAWRHPRPEEQEIRDQGERWHSPEKPPSNTRTVWVMWADYTEGFGAFMHHERSWWRVRPNGPIEPTRVSASGWREYSDDDSGSVELSRELIQWMRRHKL